MSNKLQKLFLSILPALFFAPRIIPLLALPVTALLTLPVWLKALQATFRSCKNLLILPLLLLCYLGVSLLWSANPLRGIIILAVFLCILVISVSYRSLLTSGGLSLKNLEKSLFVGAIVASVFCWLQFSLDLLNIPRSVTLLCTGCTKEIFGFPHVNGFTLEPQFMGALFLLPTFIAIIRKKPLLTALFSATLFLTFSRGAILAFLVGFVILAICRRSILRFTPIVVIFFLLVFSLQNIFSQNVNPIAHLSNQTESSPITAESQNIRLRLWRDAVVAWNSPQLTQPTFIRLSPTSTLFGVGLGGSGPALHSTDAALGSDTEIVQNEYLELLLELGLVGVVLLALFLLQLHKTSHATATLLALKTAPLVSLLFFSGLPNALLLYFLLFFVPPQSPEAHLP